jgi:hypothetical protein
MSLIGPFGLDLPDNAHFRDTHVGKLERSGVIVGLNGPPADGVTTFTFGSDANATLSQVQYVSPILKVTGAVISVTRNIVYPLFAGARLLVVNAEAHSVQIIGATGTGITVATDKTAMLWCDGTNWLRVTADT